MIRASLLAASLLTLAACSSGDDTEPPPPLETEAPTTTVAPPPTEAPETTTTSTTTTAVAETTTTPTTVAETTTTIEPEPVDSVTNDSVVDAEIDAIAAEAFIEYEETWLLVRTAFEDPTNNAIREQLRTRFASGSGQAVFDGLDEFADSSQRSLSPDPDGSQQVLFVRSVAGVDETVVFFRTCETFSAPVIDTRTGEPTYEGIDSTLREVEMRFEEEAWRVRETVALDRFVGPSCA